jgi:hypothetical protein
MRFCKWHNTTINRTTMKKHPVEVLFLPSALAWNRPATFSSAVASEKSGHVSTVFRGEKHVSDRSIPAQLCASTVAHESTKFRASILCSRVESNHNRELRKLAFYPLNYESSSLCRALYHTFLKNEVSLTGRGIRRCGVTVATPLPASA